MDDSGIDEAILASMTEGLSGIEGSVADHVAAAREVGQALRRVIDRLTATSAPPEVLREAVARLAPIEDLLRPYEQVVRTYTGTAEASGLGHDRAFFDWSPLLGLANPLAPPIRAWVEGRTVVGQARFGIAYEGPPGCVHGGYIAAAFDEMLGLTQSLSGQAGMTGTLTVRYRKPTPLHRELRLECTVDSVQGRKVLTSGRMYAGETLTAEATGLFISIQPETFRALSAQRERPAG
jgi:acyl-coenzyme A thioesterase PaaI-like protein